ncbi:MAG: diguanylate cyclase [Thiotrichales bacterium]|nr:diguanylate cyclase [Thiotrichales bacterium]
MARGYRSSTQKKVFWLFSLLFFVILIGFGTASLRFLHQFVINDFYNESFFVSRLFIKNFDATLNQGKDLVDSVELSPVVQHFFEAPDKTDRTFLEKALLSKIISFKNASQLRLLSPEGMELVRIDRKFTTGELVIVPRKALQDKSQRYYHQEVLKLKGKAFYFSNFDLNIEHKKVVEPYEPTIRIGQKIYLGKRFVGYVMLNINLAHFIESLRNAEEMDFFVTDQYGHILIGKTPQESWHENLGLSAKILPVLRHDGKTVDLTKNLYGNDFRAEPLYVTPNQKLYLVSSKSPSLFNQVPSTVAMELLTSFFMLLVLVAIFIWVLALRVFKWISEYELRSRMLDKVSDSVYVYDAKGQFIYANQQAWKKRGYDEKTFKQLNIVQLNTPEYKRNVKDLIADLRYVPNKVFRAEHVMKTGKRLPVEVSASLFDMEGNEVVLNVARDIGEQLKHEKLLINLEQRYRQLMDESPAGIFEMSDDYTFTYANKVFLDLFHAESIEQLNSDELPGLRKMLVPFVTLVHEKHMVQDFECDVTCEKQALSKRYFRMNGVMRNQKMIATCMDISQQREQALMNQLWTQLISQIEDLIMVTDLSGKITYINKAFTQVTGYEEKDVLGQSPRILSSGQHSLDFYTNLWRTLLSGKSFRDIFINQRADGSVYYEDKTITPVCDDRGQISAFVSSSRVITEQVLKEKALKHQAEHDALTGLYNRYTLNMRLNQLMEQFKEDGIIFCVIFFDIDHFKQVNDTYGHEVGDIVLKQIAEIVDLHSRHSDVFARWGGEEFVLVVCDSDLEQAMKVAEVLRARIAESHSDSRPDVTASFGVAQVNQGDDLESLIKRADAAMYQAKQNGRNQVYSLT